jgi:uncharacterized membrane protein YesL
MTMRLRISHDVLSTALGAAYLGLVTNALLAAACLPFLVVLVSTDPSATWPVLVLLAPTTFPALVAACTVFADSTDGVVRTFARAWRRSLRKACTLGLIATVLVAVPVVDIRVVFGQRLGAVLIPVLAVLALLGTVATIHAVVALADAPAGRLRDLLWWSTLLGVRHWFLSLVSIGVLGLQAAFLAQRPALALGVSAAPLLYVVWANARHTLRPAFVPTAGAVVTA